MSRRIGCAGWSLPREFRAPPLSYLERYGQLFDCVEINSSFYRHHRPQTYERWADSVHASFRFSVKVPKAVTHSEFFHAAVFERFSAEVEQLGPKLGAFLFQFPPSLACSTRQLDAIFGALRHHFPQLPSYCEPRHPSWFNADVEAILKSYRVEWVAADPQPITAAPAAFDAQPRSYYRLHGWPRIYYSRYSYAALESLAQQALRQQREHDVWFIFDNTASGAAFGDALTLQRLLGVQAVLGATL